ncbi:MAG: DUF2877 domain-containing protein [Pseudomonadales bacterium]
MTDGSVNPSAAHRLLSATSIGDGVALACQSASMPGHGIGHVVGAFDSGFYVGAAETLFAVGGPNIPAGPIHLVLEAAPPPAMDQAIVRLEPDRLWVDSCTIKLAHAVCYRPTQPPPRHLRALAPTLARLDRCDAVPKDVEHVWMAVRLAVEHADLHAARKLLEGLGEGLTPTGDDVLAGLVLFARWADPLSDVPADVALRAATSDLSRCFLTWAAAGQSIQPVHDVIDTASQLVSGVEMANDSFGDAVKTVASIGGSSGSAMLAGLGLAAAAWPEWQRE